MRKRELNLMLKSLKNNLKKTSEETIKAETRQESGRKVAKGSK
jgi:ribosomal protein RSM22 (predicted rRNA methylase)